MGGASSLRSRLSAALPWLGGIAVVAGLAALPNALLAIGTARARACLASIAEPRGPDAPDCARELPWFMGPARVPWTASSARYRAEELAVRAAIARYDDAVLGVPDARALEAAGDGLAPEAERIEKGSRRVVVEELGSAVGAPDLGRSAMLAGDRRALRAHPEAWVHWSVRLRTLEAALLDGELAQARSIAALYAGGDVSDEDLRVEIAALLCLGDRPDVDRAVELLASLEGPRARDRHESWTRSWGDLRGLVTACAAKAKRAPPRPPTQGDGGPEDHVEARSAIRLRVARDLEGAEGPGLRLAAREAMDLLRAGPLPPGIRVRLLASLLASDFGLDASLVAALATPRTAEGEPALVPPKVAVSVIDWLDAPRDLRPSPSRLELRHATDRLERLAASPEIGSAERAVLASARASTALEAARAFALAGDAPNAMALLDRDGVQSSAAARALARSTALYLAGERERALSELDGAAPDLDRDPAIAVEIGLQRATLLASLGRGDEAARAALAVDDAAKKLGDRALDVRAQWTRLAFAPSSPLRAPAPSPLPGTRLWPWTGEMATTASWLDAGAESPLALSRALAAWEGARRAPSNDKRAMRYAAASRHRGDGPRDLAVYLAVAASLVPAGEGDAEIWLDALSATLVRRSTLRAYAWARAEAARFRGDTASAARWYGSYRALVGMASAPGDGELAEALGI